jgi:hypothetical protein
MDTTTLRDAYRTLLDAAAIVAKADPAPIPPADEWNADQILAHVAVVNAATISTLSAITSGLHTTYDNRVSQDAWTLAHVSDVAGGNEGLRERIRAQGEALCVLAGPMLSETELDTPVPARLVPKTRSCSISPYRCGTSSPASRTWSYPATRPSSAPSCRKKSRNNEG